jgi:CheY-like chemotaxis protein
MNIGQSLGVVLLVEDEPLLRDDIAEALRDAGWEVLEASSGETAIVFLQSGRQIDVILTDIQLAGVLSGWDVAERGRQAHAATPVIYTSGNSADRSRRVEPSLFFAKPYQTADIVKACRRLRML